MAAECASAATATNPAKRIKLTGRAFYESIGSPKIIVAPMVDRSEFAWRLLTRSYLPPGQQDILLAYTPMLHARLFHEQQHFRASHFQPTRQPLTSDTSSDSAPYLDGNPTHDRPLIVQFCANTPQDFLAAARYVAPYCDAVDLNLGCPQGIARAGHYGAFLQEDWPLIHSMIRKLRDELDVPVTAKMRILDDRGKTLDYARMIVDAGASILTVHGRRREQKGHNMGVADWSVIRFLREQLPPEVVMFANGNVLGPGDVEACLRETGVDGVMSAEGNLSDPTIFAGAPEQGSEVERREYWWDADRCKGGYRIDGVFRRYLDVIYKHVLEKDPPERPPLYVAGDENPSNTDPTEQASKTQESENHDQEPSAKRQKTTHESSPTQRLPKKKDKARAQATNNANLKPMQGHLFQFLRPLLSMHTHIRDALARTRAGDIDGFEHVLSMVENVCAEGIRADWEARQQKANENGQHVDNETTNGEARSLTTKEIYSRPFWVCQPYIRPLPDEAIQIGAMTLSKKEKERLRREELEGQQLEILQNQERKRSIAEGKSQAQVKKVNGEERLQTETSSEYVQKELPQEEALVCG